MRIVVDARNEGPCSSIAAMPTRVELSCGSFREHKDGLDAVRAECDRWCSFKCATSSRRAAQSDDGQGPAAAMDRDVHFEPCAGTTAHHGPRLGAGRATGPSRSGLEARRAVGRVSAEVNFVGRLPAQRHVGTMDIVPAEGDSQFSTELLLAKRHQRELQTQQFLHRADEPLDCRDRAMLPDRPEARANAATLAPCLETIVPKLRSFVAHEMPGRRLHEMDRPAKQSPNRVSRWRRLERGEAHQPSGKMVQDDGNPPAERPPLRQGKRQPGSP